MKIPLTLGMQGKNKSNFSLGWPIELPSPGDLFGCQALHNVHSQTLTWQCIHQIFINHLLQVLYLRFWFLAMKSTRHSVTVTIETKWNHLKPIIMLGLAPGTYENTHIFLWNWICVVLQEGLYGSVPCIRGFQYKSLAGKKAFSLWRAALQHHSLFHNNMLHLFSQHNPATVKPGPKARHI